MFSYNGETYNSLRQFAIVNKLSISAIHKVFREGGFICDKVGGLADTQVLNRRECAYSMRHRTKDMIEYDGRKFSSRLKFARAYGLNPTTVAQLFSKGYSPEDVVDMCKKKAESDNTEFEVRGKKFYNMSTMLDYYCVPTSEFRLKRYFGLSIDDCLGFSDLVYTLKGVEYNTIDELISVTGLTVSDILSSVKLGKLELDISKKE